MKVALAFFGITRSLTFTIESIQQQILKVFDDNDIIYDIFVHTYKLTSNYINKRTKEMMDSNKINNDEYKLLNPTHFQIDDQDEIKRQLNLTQYRTCRDPWNTNYNSVDNFILGNYSKAQLVKMIENTGIQYDYVIYIRPDCQYITPFSLDFFQHINNKTICIPNFHLFGPHKFNDRFCITNMKTYKAYGELFYRLLEISKRQPLHAETVLGQRIHNHGIIVVRIPFYFSRVRCDGRVVDKF